MANRSTHQHRYPPPSLPTDTPRAAPFAPFREGARGTAFVGASLVELLRFRAAVQADDCAYTFLRDGESQSDAVNYGQIDRRSRAIAVLLQARVRPGDRALLLYPPGLDFIAAFFGCLYAGVVAVPAFPPNFGRSDRSLMRLVAIAADAAPAAVLSTNEIAARWGRAAVEAGFPRLMASEGEAGARAREPEWIATDAVCDAAATAWIDPGADRRTLAFLQYTSGSTAAPKGVIVTHGNLLHNLAYAFHLADNDASSVSVSWLPVTHDMGLIDGVLQPAYSGCPAYLMSSTAFLQRPVRWLQAISRYHATRSGAPNFAYDLCVRKIGVEDRAGLDLSAWRTAYNGAEPIRRETLGAFTRTFAQCGFRPSAFRPCFGLAEATLLVSSGRWSENPVSPSVDAAHQSAGGRAAACTGSTVSCGAPAFGTRALIADPATGRSCDAGEIGEIWIAGPSVARGYWNRQEESERTFEARTDEGDGPFLRTGDLGFLSDGELHVTGRLKDVLIVRGVKHYPQDLEHTAERQHPAIRPGCTAAFAIEAGPSGDRIALVAEAEARQLDTPDSPPAVMAAVRRAVAELHGVRLHAVVLVAPGTIPKTTSGKLQRFACREAFLAGTLPVLADWHEPPESVGFSGRGRSSDPPVSGELFR